MNENKRELFEFLCHEATLYHWVRLGPGSPNVPTRMLTFIYFLIHPLVLGQKFST